MSRYGKIARLPASVRNEVNRRLENSMKGADILSWLNAHKEVKAVVAQYFAGEEISETNLSRWRTGGYRDWERQQAALEEARLMMDEGGELAEMGQKGFADKMAIWILGQFLLAARTIRENPEDPGAWKLLRELSHDVVAIRRGEQGAEWLRLEQERLELYRERWENPKEKTEGAPPEPLMTAEERRAAVRQVLGIGPAKRKGGGKK